jgi:hypothetical protein
VKDPADPALRCEAGLIALRLGRAEEGLLWWTRALIEDLNHRPTHRALADCYERAGQPDLARRHRRQASGKWALVCLALLGQCSPGPGQAGP